MNCRPASICQVPTLLEYARLSTNSTWPPILSGN